MHIDTTAPSPESSCSLLHFGGIAVRLSDGTLRSPTRDLARRYGLSRLRSAAFARGCCRDPAFQSADFRRQFPIGCIAQKVVDTTLVLDRPDCGGGNTQPDRTEDIRKDRSPLQVRQVAPLRLVVGMANIVANLDAFSGDCASPRHDTPRPNPNSPRLTQQDLRASIQSDRPWSSASVAGPLTLPSHGRLGRGSIMPL
jgi:hypothetical protein